MVFSPKKAFFTVGVEHTTPLYKGASANEQHIRAANRGFKAVD
ncbi:MAG: hypothetical protein RLZZ386_801 [Planctomycetota bacterium]|jgi:hypothetical protein